MQPHPRQREFIKLTCEEALFGGAAGGGKTEALLMWLAEGVEIPGYTGAIFRRYIEDLTEGNSSLLAKSYKLYPSLGGSISGLEWKFPSGAVILMSGMAYDKSVLKAQGKEYHRVAFDELTHFTEHMYDFIYTSRMRKVVGFPIKCGVRASANPGGPGHEWVKARFITKESMDFLRSLDDKKVTPPGTVFWAAPDVAYVPSRIIDNPSLDREDYIKRLSKNKNPVERARMMNGDWSVAPEGLIKQHWLRYYTMTGRNVNLHGPDDAILTTFHEAECRRFITVDTAGGKMIAKEAKKNNTSWTVAGVWDYKRLGGTTHAMLCRHVWRAKVGFTDVRDKLKSLHEIWNPSKILVEDATMGPDLHNILRGEIPIHLVATQGQNKVERAHPLLNMLESGQVYLPRHENSWRHLLESEWLGWQGLDEDPNDQVDMSAYAAIECQGGIAGVVKLLTDPRQPAAIGTGSRSLWY